MQGVDGMEVVVEDFIGAVVEQHSQPFFGRDPKMERAGGANGEVIQDVLLV
jgi:hypothetical protein